MSKALVKEAQSLRVAEHWPEEICDDCSNLYFILEDYFAWHPIPAETGDFESGWDMFQTSIVEVSSCGTIVGTTYGGHPHIHGGHLGRHCGLGRLSS